MMNDLSQQISSVIITDFSWQIFRISQTTGQMRLSCRRRSFTPSEDVLQKEDEKAEDDDVDLDDNVLQGVQCKRRMAVVMD